MAQQSNITLSAMNAQSWVLSTGFLAFCAYFLRDYSCLLSTDSIDFKLGNGFDGTASLRNTQLSVMTLKHRKGRVTLTQAQYATSCMRDHSRMRWRNDRTRCNNAKTQHTLEEGVIAKTLNGVKVALAQTQKGKVAFEDFTVGNPRAHGKYRINQRIDVNVFEVCANKRQARVGTEVVGQFFDNKVSHVRIHLLGDRYMRLKSLISIQKSTFLDYEVTDSG